MKAEFIKTQRRHNYEHSSVHEEAIMRTNFFSAIIMHVKNNDYSLRNPREKGRGIRTSNKMINVVGKNKKSKG